MNAAKTPAQRQADLTKARKAAGLKRVHNLWAYPEDEAAIKEYAALRSRLRRSGDETKEGRCNGGKEKTELQNLGANN